MRRLLASNFSRLIKSKVFWICNLAIGLVALALLGQYYSEVQDGNTRSLEIMLFGYALLTGILTPGFASLFLGTEYSNGTIRNKLIAGHSRIKLYLANLITVFCAAVSFCFSYLVVTILIGPLLLGWPHISGSLFIMLFLETILTVAAFSTLFTMLCMLQTSKSLATALSMALAFMLLVMAVYGDNRLIAEELEIYGYTSFISEEGEAGYEPMTRPNPYYLGGALRKVYEFESDLNPFAQSLQLVNRKETVEGAFGRMPWYSMAIALVNTAVGMFFFRKKDIK